MCPPVKCFARSPFVQRMVSNRRTRSMGSRPTSRRKSGNLFCLLVVQRLRSDILNGSNRPTAPLFRTALKEAPANSVACVSETTSVSSGAAWRFAVPNKSFAAPSKRLCLMQPRLIRKPHVRRTCISASFCPFLLDFCVSKTPLNIEADRELTIACQLPTNISTAIQCHDWFNCYSRTFCYIVSKSGVGLKTPKMSRMRRQWG